MTAKKLPPGYIALWGIALSLLALIIISFGIFHIGYGRWECNEPKNVCTITKDDWVFEVTQEQYIELLQTQVQLGLTNYWTYNCEKKCDTYVWTYHPKED